MDQINIYIEQCRQQGQTDEQIHQSLMASGWSIEQVSAVLPSQIPAAPISVSGSPAVGVVQPTPQSSASMMPIVSTEQVSATMPQQQAKSKTRSKKLPLIIAGSLALLLIILGSAFFLIGSKSYQTVMQQFITAIRDKHQATANSLESPAFKSQIQKYYKTRSFYSVCQQYQYGTFCTSLFTTNFIDTATKTYKDYKASNGTEGKEIIYTLKQSLSGARAGGQGCSSTSTTTLTIAAVPKGNSWLIDNVSPSFNNSPNGCSNSSGT
jgi:hypothetical protein